MTTNSLNNLCELLLHQKSHQTVDNSGETDENLIRLLKGKEINVLVAENCSWFTDILP